MYLSTYFNELIICAISTFGKQRKMVKQEVESSAKV